MSNIEKELSEITKYPGDDELQIKFEKLEQEVGEIKKRIDSASSKPSISTESVNAIKALSVSVKNETQKRQKLVSTWTVVLMPDTNYEVQQFHEVHI